MVSEFSSCDIELELGVELTAGANLTRMMRHQFWDLPKFRVVAMSVDLESVGQVSLLPLLLSLFLIPQSGGSADVPYLYSALSWVTLIPFCTYPSQFVFGVWGNTLLRNFLLPMQI